MIGISDICLIGDTFFVGIGGIKDEFVNSAVPDEMKLIHE